eukprot:tig00021493_g21857.t1
MRPSGAAGALGLALAVALALLAALAAADEVQVPAGLYVSLRNGPCPCLYSMLLMAEDNVTVYLMDPPNFALFEARKEFSYFDAWEETRMVSVDVTALGKPVEQLIVVIENLSEGRPVAVSHHAEITSAAHSAKELEAGGVALFSSGGPCPCHLAYSFGTSPEGPVAVFVSDAFNVERAQGGLPLAYYEEGSVKAGAVRQGARGAVRAGAPAGEALYLVVKSLAAVPLRLEMRIAVRTAAEPEVALVAPAPTAGGTLQLYGIGLGPAELEPGEAREVSVGGAPCPAPAAPAPHYSLACALPPGIGAGHEVLVRVFGRASRPSPRARFAYLPPEVAAVAAPPLEGGLLVAAGWNMGPTAPRAFVAAAHQTVACVAPPALSRRPRSLQVEVGGQASAPFPFSYRDAGEDRALASLGEGGAALPNAPGDRLLSAGDGTAGAGAAEEAAAGPAEAEAEQPWAVLGVDEGTAPEALARWAAAAVVAVACAPGLPAAILAAVPRTPPSTSSTPPRAPAARLRSAAAAVAALPELEAQAAGAGWAVEALLPPRGPARRLLGILFAAQRGATAVLDVPDPAFYFGAPVPAAPLPPPLPRPALGPPTAALHPAPAPAALVTASRLFPALSPARPPPRIPPLVRLRAPPPHRRAPLLLFPGPRARPEAAPGALYARDALWAALPPPAPTPASPPPARPRPLPPSHPPLWPTRLTAAAAAPAPARGGRRERRSCCWRRGAGRWRRRSRRGGSPRGRAAGALRSLAAAAEALAANASDPAWGTLPRASPPGAPTPPPAGPRKGPRKGGARGWPAPYLSIVVVTRNDDYGGGLRRRFQVFLNSLADGAGRAGAPLELVVVDWNTPPGRRSVMEEYEWPVRHNLTYRFVRVPPGVHRRFPNHAKIPLFEWVGKNAGVRRARGEYVLVTNQDVLLPDAFFAALAARRLRPDAFYLARRFDANGTHLPEAPRAAVLADFLRRSRSNPIFLTKERAMPYAEWAELSAAPPGAPRPAPRRAPGGGPGAHRLGGPPRLRVRPAPRPAARRTPPTLRPHAHPRGGSFGQLTMDFPGDFLLAHGERWRAARGYPEHATSSFCDAFLPATFSSMSLFYVFLKAPIVAFHQDHVAEHVTRPMTPPALLEEYKRAAAEGRPLIHNVAEKWGLWDLGAAVEVTDLAPHPALL